MSTKHQRNKQRQWAKDCARKGMWRQVVRAAAQSDAFMKTSAIVPMLFRGDAYARPSWTESGIRWGYNWSTKDAPPEDANEIRTTRRTIATKMPLDVGDCIKAQRILREIQSEVERGLNQRLAEACAAPAELMGNPRPWTSAEVAEMRERDFERSLKADVDTWWQSVTNKKENT